MNARLKPMPSLRSDTAAEAFVQEADLSSYDLSGFKPMRYELHAKAAALNMRLPQALLEAIKKRAQAQGVPYTRYVRHLLEQDVARAGQ